MSHAARLLPLAAICFLQLPTMASAQAVPPEHANTARIDKLLSQMTIEEKMNLIRGAYEPAATNQGQAGYLPGVPRLGIPSLRMADGPPGVLTRIPAQAETATMGVAATWSRRTAEQNGVVIGREAPSVSTSCSSPSSTSTAISPSPVATTPSAKIPSSPEPWALPKFAVRSRRT